MNNKGFGLLGMLISVIIVAILMAAVLKQYAGQTKRMMSLPGATLEEQQKILPAPAKNVPAKPGAVQAAPARAACDGRQVGNMCIPTEIRSSALDEFEKMNQ